MLETLSLIISINALLFALPIVPGIARARLTLIFVALGCGQIYLAFAAYGLFLVSESRWRLETGISNLGFFVALVILLGIGVTTAVVPTSARTIPELIQLALYVVMTLLTMNYLRDGDDVQRVLSAAVLGSAGMTAISLVSIVLGLQSSPAIFLARGANEGSVFLSTIGALPAAILFVRSRNPFYVVCLLLFAYAQYLATARGSLVVTGVAGLGAAFFVWRLQFLRVILILIGLYIVMKNVPLLNATYQENLNFSARERLALAEYGYWLWEQRPITGWGWGSTTYLAQTASTTELVYPHFHNTYVQLLVEAGVVGWAIIALFLFGCIRLSSIAMVRYRVPHLSALVVIGSMALAISGMFDAMLYGADRAVQVIILLSLMYRAVAIAGRPAMAFTVKQPPDTVAGGPQATATVAIGG